MSKWGYYLEEEERVPSSSGVGSMETVASVPEEIVGSSLRRRGMHFTPTSVQPPGLGYRSQWRWRRSGDSVVSSSVVIKFSFRCCCRRVLRLGGVRNMMAVDGDVAKRCAYGFKFHRSSIPSYFRRSFSVLFSSISYVIFRSLTLKYFLPLRMIPFSLLTGPLKLAPLLL